MIRSRAPLILLLLLFLNGCSTARKRAQEALENNQYQQAIDQYEVLLKSDPNDAELRLGLQQAREGWIDQRLIEVRRARMASNLEQALDLLLEAFQRQNAWSLTAGGKVGFTQTEEVEFAWAFARKAAQEALAQQRPLRAEYFLKHYRILFEERFSATYAPLAQKTFQQGKQSCKTFAKSVPPGKFYLSQFASQHCRYWGESGLSTARAAADPDIAPSFQRMQWNASIVSLSPERLGGFTQALFDRFKKTAWYNPQSQAALPAKLTGRYLERLTREPRLQNHRYWVREQVNQKEFKSVEKTFTYWAQQVNQTLELELLLELELGSQPLSITLSEKSETGGMEHQENHPKLELYPSRAQLQEIGPWFNSQSEGFSKKFEDQLIQIWKDRYCRDDASNASGDPNLPSAQGNRVLRCIQQPLPQYPAFVENWHRQHFGLSCLQALSLLDPH